MLRVLQTRSKPTRSSGSSGTSGDTEHEFDRARRGMVACHKSVTAAARLQAGPTLWRGSHAQQNNSRWQRSNAAPCGRRSERGTQRRQIREETLTSTVSRRGAHSRPGLITEAVLHTQGGTILLVVVYGAALAAWD